MKNVTIIREDVEGIPTPFSNIEVEGFNFQMVDISLDNQENIDKYFTERVDEMEATNPDIVFLPSWLGQPLHYLGVRLAMHIRLSGKDELSEVPIVFLGAEEEIDFHRNCRLSRFLNSARVYYVNLTLDDVINFLRQYNFAKELNKPFDLVQQVQNYFDISPPSNYRSHHSVDNDWALLRWSQYIGCDDKIPEVKENLNSGLYFKWLQAKYGVIQEVAKTKQFNFQEKSEVLLIDDEAEKGWYTFYEQFLSNSPSVNFGTLNLDFNLVEKNVIINEAKQKINESDPDVILLDLRLCDEDFAEKVNPEELTGYQILNKAKEINEGIQVIITTASNKVWNYQALQKAGANDFLMKSMQSDVEEDILGLKSKLEIALKRQEFLKPIFSHYKSAYQGWETYTLPKRGESSEDQRLPKYIHQPVQDAMKASFETLKNEAIEENYTLALLQLFRVLEFITEYFIEEEGDKNSPKYSLGGNYDIKYFHWDKRNNRYQIEDHEEGKRMPIDQKAFNIYYYLKSSINDELFSGLWRVKEYRNKVAIHPDERQKQKSLEYLHDNDFDKFKNDIKKYFSSVFRFVQEIAS